MTITTPREAELNAAELMRGWGYLDARATPVGADAGIDIWSRQALAEVKFEIKPSGRPYMQKLYGARKGGKQHLYFFTASGYSQAAIDYANEIGISLYLYSRDTGKARAVNALDVPVPHSWVSHDYIVLLRCLRAAVRVLSPKTTNRTYRRYSAHRRAHTR